MNNKSVPGSYRLSKGFYSLMPALIVMAFFVICRCGFFLSDDLAMAYGDFSSIRAVFQHASWFYMNLGGRFFSVASQYLFCGLLKQKIWFDLINTLFFALLIIVCGKLVSDKKEERGFSLLVFTILFWFLCPVPSQTLFWVAGATTHMWANTLAFLFLLLFLRYKDGDFSAWGKTGLFFFSVLSAAEFIPCASICGAFVTYYAFHAKAFRRNAVVFVTGFAVGSVLVLFAPGSFSRASEELTPFGERVTYLLSHPLLEMVKFKALWLFVWVLAWGWIRDRQPVKAWMKQNAFLLLSLGWAILAFSVVFRPANRALFFPETLSLVLCLRFVFDNRTSLFGWTGRGYMVSGGMLAIAILFFFCMLDSAFAVVETRKQNGFNTEQLKKLAASGGIVALDRISSSHRKAYAPDFPKWTWEPLADRFGLDSVHVYPHFCQDKWFGEHPLSENVFIEDNDAEDDLWKRYARLTWRVKEEDMSTAESPSVLRISYSRPRKWYRTWLKRFRHYQYDRVEVVPLGKPEACFGGYRYYVVWMKKENLENLTALEMAGE